MNILIASPIDSAAIEKLRQKHHVICAFNADTPTLQAQIKQCQVLIFRSGVSITAQVMDCAPDLKLLVRAGSGIDNLDVAYVQKRGLELVWIPQPGAKAVAEMSFAFMLALSRNLLEADRSLRQGRWIKHQLTGYLLTGKVLGIIGVGNIGLRVAQLGAAWGMKVIGYDNYASPELAAAKGVRLVDLDELLSSADYVSIHVPLDDSTHYMINADVLARVKPGAYLINLARGGVVDEQALYKALTEGRLRGAALDVHEQEGEGKISPLSGLSNVILSPHIGAMTIDSQSEIGSLVIETINAFAAQVNE